MNILVIVLIVLSFLCLYRIWRGPTIPDRMVAIYIFGILVVGLCGLWAMSFKTDFLIDIALTWVLLSFIGTLALAKYLSGKKFDE